MNFNKREFYRFLIIVFYSFLVLTVIFLFISLLPVILLIGLIIWQVAKIRRKKMERKFNSRSYNQFDSSDSLRDSSKEDVIDVEYKEVKK